MTPESIIKRFQQLRSERSSLDDQWEDIGRYVVPGKANISQGYAGTSEESQRRDYPEKFDSTAVTSAQSLAAAIHSGLTSPATKWFGLRFRDEKLNENQEAVAWLQACEEKIFYSIQASNFNLEATEMYLDVVTFGTSIMFHEIDSTGRFKYRTANAREVYFEEDFNGKPINILIPRWLTMTQLVTKFKDSLPDTFEEQAKDPNVTPERYRVIQAILFNTEEYTIDDLPLEGPLAIEKRPYREFFILENGAVDLTLEPRGYYEMPGYVVRWGRTAGSKYGFSPALNVLPDIRTLNSVVDMSLQAAAKAIDPPMGTTQRGVFGDLDLSAGGVSVLRSKDDIFPIVSNLRFDISELQREHLIRTIREAFMTDQLELPQNDRMTAAEVQIRYERMQSMMGPAMTRFQADYLDPNIHRSFYALARLGLLPEKPPMLADTEIEYEINYIGPLARAQQMTEVQATERMIMGLNNIAPIKPEVLDTIDWDKTVISMALKMGVPAEQINSDETIAVMREQRAKQEQMAQMAQMGQQLAGAMKDGASANKSNAEAATLQ